MKKLVWQEIVLGFAIVLYIVYFSAASIYRMNSLNAHYFDLGIMHQTTYNTYKSITTLDFSRFLEFTDPYGPNQLKRMAIHNDVILVLLAPFYIFHDGPETLLVLQSVILGLGALGIYLIAKKYLQKVQNGTTLSLVAAIAYLLYPTLGYTNLYEFHGVTLATTFLIFMFYFGLIKKHIWSLVFGILCILTKEQVSLTVAFYALYFMAEETYVYYQKHKIVKLQFHWFPITLFLISVSWFLLSLKVIMPYFRGGRDHFALDYYGEFGDSPTDVVVNLLKNPLLAGEYLFKEDVQKYIHQLFLPVGYLSFLAPFVLAIATPEFGVNLLSNNGNMRYIIYHYTSVLNAFVLLSMAASLPFVIHTVGRFTKKHISEKNIVSGLCIFILGFSFYSAYSYGPLPFASKGQTYMFKANPENKSYIDKWAYDLKNEEIKVATTGKLAPFFSSRRYYYVMSDRYTMADYVVLNPVEVGNSYGSEWAIPAYAKLQVDPNFEKIFSIETLEVYKKR